MTRPCAPWFSNLTRPVIFAKMVSSLPSPAFRPGLNRRPRWRTMIVPPLTRLPSCAFTPRRCELESRPFRELPCPFLCAIHSHDDVLDAHAGVRRAMSPGLPHRLAPLLLEDANLGSPRIAFDDGNDAR